MSTKLARYTTHLRVAYDLELQSTDGKRVPFGELVLEKGDHITTIIVFVCHFFCTYDQFYNSQVSYHLTDSVLGTIPEPYGFSQLIIIGCGKPVFITPYITATGSAFPVFTGPSGKIYEKIHITRPAAKMRQPPSYLQVSFFRAMGITVKRIWRNRGKTSRGEPSDRNSRRDVFLDRKRVYVRREDHAEQLTAEKLLGILDCDAGKESLLSRE